MPPTPLADLYALALRTLDAHERRAGELRSRVAPVLAAGGLGVTLLSGPAFAGASTRAPALAALVIALAGLCVALSGATALLLRRSFVVDFDAAEIAGRIEAEGMAGDHDAFATEMIAATTEQLTALKRDVELLHRRFTVIVYGMLVTLCGLAVAALVG